MIELVVESVPEIVIVYDPFGGSEGALLLVELLPHAVSTRPSDASAITQASCRSLRDDLPRKPATSNPANAIPAGIGLPFFGA